MRVIDTGDELIENTYSVLLIERGGKIPAYRFKDTPPLTTEEFRRRYRTGMNLAIRLPGLVALDADDEPARRMLHELPESPITQESPRGGEHRVYRLPEGITLGCRQRLFGCGFDLKTGPNAYLMFSPSYSQEHGRRYRLLGEIVPPIELPEFDVTWIQEETRQHVKTLVSRPSEAVPAMERVFRYIDRIEPAKSGHAGHNKMFGAACRILRVFEWLTWDQFWQALCYYNSRCDPPFDEQDRHALPHKAADAWMKERGSR